MLSVLIAVLENTCSPQRINKKTPHSVRAAWLGAFLNRREGPGMELRMGMHAIYARLWEGHYINPKSAPPVRMPIVKHQLDSLRMNLQVSPRDSRQVYQRDSPR